MFNGLRAISVDDRRPHLCLSHLKVLIPGDAEMPQALSYKPIGFDATFIVSILALFPIFIIVCGGLMVWFL